MLAQWDDHDVTDNWYPHEDLAGDPGKAAYKVTSVDLLAARAARAFMEYLPVRRHPLDPERLYAAFGYGPALDVFRIDMRSYRGPNSANDQAEPGPDTAFLGPEQIRWLKQALRASRATWKVIAADMPLGLIVWDDFRAPAGLRGGRPGGSGSAARARARDRGPAAVHPRRAHRQRGLADRRRALHRGPLL